MEKPLFFSFFDMPYHFRSEKVSSRSIAGKELMLVEHRVKKGHITAKETHENEQLTLVLSGSLKFTIENHSYFLKKGDALLIPSFIPHDCEVLEDSALIEIFSPPRKEWISSLTSL